VVVALHGARRGRLVVLGLYPIATSQYSSTTLYRVPYHVQKLFLKRQSGATLGGSSSGGGAASGSSSCRSPAGRAS
jgi:hypothetical protein